MKQKKYEKPSIEVVKVQTTVAMLEGSPTGDTTVNNYDRDSTPDVD